MDLNAIQTFIEVVRAGGFWAAARRLGMPRSTVSLRVRTLEESLGVRLLKRSTRGVALTERARAVRRGGRRARHSQPNGDARQNRMCTSSARTSPRGGKPDQSSQV